jgi:hypothetical protein
VGLGAAGVAALGGGFGFEGVALEEAVGAGSRLDEAAGGGGAVTTSFALSGLVPGGAIWVASSAAPLLEGATALACVTGAERRHMTTEKTTAASAPMMPPTARTSCVVDLGTGPRRGCVWAVLAQEGDEPVGPWGEIGRAESAEFSGAAAVVAAGMMGMTGTVGEIERSSEEARVGVSAFAGV